MMTHAQVEDIRNRLATGGHVFRTIRVDNLTVEEWWHERGKSFLLLDEREGHDNHRVKLLRLTPATTFGDMAAYLDRELGLEPRTPALKGE